MCKPLGKGTDFSREGVERHRVKNALFNLTGLIQPTSASTKTFWERGTHTGLLFETGESLTRVPLTGKIRAQKSRQQVPTPWADSMYSWQ